MLARREWAASRASLIIQSAGQFIYKLDASNADEPHPRFKQPATAAKIPLQRPTTSSYRRPAPEQLLVAPSTSDAEFRRQQAGASRASKQLEEPRQACWLGRHSTEVAAQPRSDLWVCCVGDTWPVHRRPVGSLMSGWQQTIRVARGQPIQCDTLHTISAHAATEPTS